MLARPGFEVCHLLGGAGIRVFRPQSRSAIDFRINNQLYDEFAVPTTDEEIPAC
jgi:hypothetical protein